MGSKNKRMTKSGTDVFKWSNTSALAFTFTKIDPPGSIFTELAGINDPGQIVGEFVDSSGEHGFLAVP